MLDVYCMPRYSLHNSVVKAHSVNDMDGSQQNVHIHIAFIAIVENNSPKGGHPLVQSEGHFSKMVQTKRCSKGQLSSIFSEVYGKQEVGLPYQI